MMGDTKLCLWLLLCAVVFTNAQEEEATCFLAKRFKSFQKYEYSYETESLNALNGEINGPRATCKVEIEVPGSCTYILHTSQCSLTEVTHVDAEGKPVFGAPAGADAFRNAMEKYPLKFTADGDHDISLFPEDDEPVNILNIKRGLISALAAPAPKEQRSKRMPTIYGPCTTGYTETSGEDVTLHRDLTTCEHFRPARDHTSPLALITGLNYPLAQLMRSSQTCNYMFDGEQKHMTSGSCTEKHIFVPFSYKRQYGFTNVGKQVLTLEGVSVHNDRIFDHNEANMKSLHLDNSIAAVHPIHDKDAMLTVLTELTGLSKTDDGQNRAPLAHKLVDVVRKMDAEALTAALPEALEVSRSLTYQALFQCGTPECTIAILQVLRTLDSSSLEIDAVVYAMGMVPNPSAVLVKEMLEMAKFKSSKPIFYALSNAVRRLYEKEGMVTPEIQAVFDYMRDQIGDCTGNQDHLFLTLRVIGNMAVGDTGSDLKSAVLQCVNQPQASAEVQQAAIQVFRDITLSEQDRDVLMQVVLDEAAPVQKCVAAYLVLMKNPLPSELAQLLPALAGSSRLQFRSFVNSHLSNILSSTAPESKGLREKILNVLQGNEIEKGLNPMQYSRNYKIGSLEGNVIFESTDLLPNEAVLEMTLNAFGFDIDVFEIGMNGKGLEPAIDALVGIDGFFADTMKKTMNYAAEKIPRGNDVLHKMFPKLWSDIKMKQVPQSIIKEITSNVNKLIQTLKAQDNPEAMIYLRLLGAELGYVNTKDVAEMASSAGLLASSLLKMFPANFIRNLFSSINNDLFLHYIFMDHEFYLPTGAGVPLRVAFSGTFAPGAKGGLMLAKDMSEVAFMPSAGVEFVTEVGALLPEYVESGLEMHTNFYHESGLRATVDAKVDQVKLSIPAPQSPAKLFSVTNSLVSVTGEKSRAIPAVTDPISVEKCFPFLPGLKSCSSLYYSPAFSSDSSPYFPLTGDSKFALELRPTGEVSAYTLTLSHTSDEKTDTMSLDLKAEGASFESTAKVTFDREENTLSASLEIPTYDVEAGITVKPKTKVDARSVQIDFLNKKIVQASLLALAEIETDRDVQLQVQLLVPRLQTNAKVTAKLQFDEALIVELESDLQLPETSSVQKVLFKYDALEKLEVTFTSDVNSEIHNSISTDAIKAIVEEILDQEIGQSGTKIRDVFTQTVTASSEYMEKYAVDIPYLQKLAVPEITVPEKLFMNVEGAAQVKFGQRFYSVIIPLPFVEEIARDLNLPRALQRDHTSLTLPLAGQLEMSSKLSSNFYNMEASATVGREDDEEPRYSAVAEVTGTSTVVELLSFKTEGSAAVAALSEETIQAEVKSSFSHKLLETQFRVLEEVTSADKIKIKSSSKFEASSLLGLKVSLEHTGQVGAAAEEISGDGQLLSSVEVGPVNAEASLKQSVVLFPLKTEAKMDSSLKVDSAFIRTENLIEVVLINGEASFVSKTTAFGDSLTNTAEVTYKDSVVSLKSDTKAKALDFNFQNSAEASVGPYMVNFRIEMAGDKIEDPVTGGFRSMVSAALGENGLALHSDASASLAEHTASHKCMLSLTSIGFSTSGTTSLKSPLSFENKFEGAFDTAKLSFSSETMGKFAEMTIKNSNALSATLSTLSMTTKADAKIADGTSYNHAMSLQLEPYSTLVSINNHLAVLHVNLINDARFSAQGYKADLTGSVKLAAGSEELKHTYEFRYADLAATAKFGTSGKLLGSHVSHNAEVEIVGAAVTFRDEARFSSQYLRFDGTVNAVAVPFKLNIDAIANADGDVYFYGKHSGQFYTKFLLKAEPLAIAHSHECRVSTTQNLNNGLLIETNLDKKTDTVLTPSEQKATVLVKSKLNGHIFSQTYKAYNTPEKLGLETSGSMITNLFNTQSSEDQDHFYSAFIKYDKNTNSRIISLPFLRNILENIKMSIVRFAEAMRSFISREDTVENIQKLAKKIGDAVSQLNLKSKVEEITKDLTDFYQQNAISINDLEDFLMTFKPALLQLVTDLDAHVEKISEIAKEMMASGSLSVVQKLSEINEKYDIRAMVVAIIEMIEDVIKQIDLNELKESSAVFFQNLEEQYDIRIKLEETVSKLKQMVADFDQVKFVEDVRSFMNSIAFQDYADRMMAQIPTEKISKIVEAVKELVTRLDIAGKCKTMCDKVREILANCEARKKFEAIFDKVVELMRKLKIEDTFRVLADTLTSVQIPAPRLLDEAITYVKTRQVKEIIEDWNTCLDKCIRYIRSFDYNAFVDEVNQNVRKHTAELNRVMSSLEIQQKLDAVREFVAYALSTVSACFEKIVNVPAFNLPEIVLPEISFPAIPKFIAQHKLTDLSIPEFNLPAIPSELEIPCLGKLYGEVKVSIPVFNMRTTMEFYNSTETAETPQFSGFITSQGSSEYDFLKYSLDSTSRIAMPKMSRIIVAETLKVTHQNLAVEHQSSLTLYGFSAQASSKSTVKIVSDFYSADVLNTAFFGLEDGMTANSKTTYNDKVNIPYLSFKADHSYDNAIDFKQDGLSFTVNIQETGKGKVSTNDVPEDFNYKGNTRLEITPEKAEYTSNGEANTASKKSTQVIRIEAVPLSYIDFNARIENSDSGKSYLFNAAGMANLRDMKVELKATQESAGLPVGFSNSFTFLMRPVEVRLDSQNKAIGKIGIPGPLSAKFELQNDYAAILSPTIQKISTLALTQFNQYKYFHNFTAQNNKVEVGIYADVNGEANLEFLTVPVTVPSVRFSFPVMFETPEIRNFNLYEHAGLKHLLTTLDQTVDVDAKIVYQKSKARPLIETSLIRIPSFGSLVSETSFKSSVLNLNANANVHAKENFVVRVSAASASVFEGLNATLEGTSSLSTKSGLKLATTVVLDNRHIDGTHKSTVSVDLQNFEVTLSSDTQGKVDLPFLKAKGSHELFSDNKPQPKAESTLKVEYSFDIPVIKLIGNGDAQNSLKLEGTPEFISAEAALKANLEGVFLDSGSVKANIDHDKTFYLNGNSLRSSLKTVGGGHLIYEKIKLEFDVDESFSLEAAAKRVFALLKFSSKNKAQVGALETRGDHSAHATYDLDFPKSLVADVKVDLSQPNPFGDLVFSEVMSVELTVPKQTLQYTTKFISPVYNLDVAAKLDGNAPVFKSDLKASATSPIAFFDYDLDSSMTTSVEGDASFVESKAVLTHADFTLDINNNIRMSVPSQTLKVDISSPTFSDLSLLYVAASDGLTTSVYTPTTGLLRVQLKPEMSVRVSRRHAESPDNDVDILTMRAVRRDEKLHLVATYDSAAVSDLCSDLREKLPDAVSSLHTFADKHGVLGVVNMLRRMLVSAVDEAHVLVSTHSPELTQLSRFFRNVIVRYQKAIKNVFDAIVTFLRETQFQLPGMEKFTLPDLCQRFRSATAKHVQHLVLEFMETLEMYLAPYMEELSKVSVTFPSGDVLTLPEIQEKCLKFLKFFLRELVNRVDEIESSDVILEDLGKALQEVVEKTQEFVDSIQSDSFDVVFSFINSCHELMVSWLKFLVDTAEDVLTFEQVTSTYDQHVQPFFTSFLQLLSDGFTSFSNNFETNVRFTEGKLEIEFPY